ERRADDATREVAERLKCIYLKDRVGEDFEVIVASVAPFGLFVRVPELAVDGLVHVPPLPRHCHHRDASGTTLTGERTGKQYRLTDKLRVRLTAVNVEERKVDFVLAADNGAPGDEAPEPPARPPRRGPGARRRRRA